MRHTIFNTHNPANIDQNSTLTVRFPDLGPNDVIVPGTAKLSFKITLNSTADAKVFSHRTTATSSYLIKIFGELQKNVRLLFIKEYAQKL